jgi:hypothetical protein
MGEVPTKRGRVNVPVPNSLDGDTLPVEPEPPSRMPAATTPLPAGERYRLGAELGRGGMGRVVEAFDLQLGRTVALKEVLAKAGPGIAKRFVREVQLTARLEHPSIIPLYDAGATADGRPFYVMRRVSGRPLDQLMSQATELGERLTLLPALLAAIDAVGHAHRRGVIHRDLKPANILVGELGETWGLAKVIGEADDRPGDQPGAVLAQASDSLRTQIGSVFGTPGFMAPEQARGEELDPRGDVYALGAILYQLLAGAPPHAGKSATEVIARTGSREVTPVNVVAPGAPADLVAIVGKALAFAAAGRYPDAGALGEDVRRFLAGQLVAAHHYTRRQHVARFARRHRAPLAVAALAMVAVAVLAWTGVSQIRHERDVAEVALRDAELQRARAVQASNDAVRRADQLVVAEARSVLDRNPTRAAAILKDVRDGSERSGDARAVAQAAVMRGVAWTMPLPDGLTVFAELSPDAAFLVQLMRDGVVRVWDLDRRRLVIARPYSADVRVLWVGKAVLVAPARAAPELLDPFAGTTQPLALGPISSAVATVRGDRVAYLDAAHAAHLLDVATRTARPLWPEHVATQLALAADGGWIALADAAGVTVLDADGRERTSHPGRAIRLFGSRFDELGFTTGDKVFACALSPAPAWTELDLKPFAPGLAFDFAYRGHELDMYVTSGKIVAWNGKRLWERLAIDGLSFRLVEAERDLLVVPTGDGQLHLVGDLVTGALSLPVTLTNPKVYARPGASRIVAIGSGMVVGFELANGLPELLHQPPGTEAVFVDDDTLLLWRQGSEWQWYDVRTQVATPFAYEPRGLIEILDVDPSDGRVLIRETTQDSSLVQVRKNTHDQRLLVHGPQTWGHLLAGGGLLFGVGDGRVLAVTDSRGATAPGAERPHEVVKLEGIAENAVALGGGRYAAISSTGELVRGELATGALTRAHVQPGSSTGAIAADPSGRVLIAADNRLAMWDRDLVALATLDKPILRIMPVDGAALLELADHAVVRVALTPGAPIVPVIAQSDKPPLISGDGRLLVGQSTHGQLIVVELATRASWELPSYFESLGLLSLSPTTRRFVQAGFGRLVLWRLPLARPDLRAWLDERTNAVAGEDRALTWARPPGAAP